MAKQKDICNFLKDRGSSKRVDIMRYMTEDIKESKISSVSETTANNWINIMKKAGEIKHRGDKYYIPKPKNTKSKSQNILKSQKYDQLEKTQEKIPVVADFTTTTKEHAVLAESLQDTFFLLDAAMYLLDSIQMDDIRAREIKDKSRYHCRIFKASIEKIINERFVHLLEPCQNKYRESIETAWNQYSEKQVHPARMVFSKISDFRHAFSDVILQMRQCCENNCKRFARYETDYKDAVYTSCKLISTSLNEICRNDYDLVVDSYEYDDRLGFFTINISELEMLSSYAITQVYCNGKYCTFVINDGNNTITPSDSDYAISFYPDSETGDSSKNTVSIMLGCIEFSFIINGKHGISIFQDHIKQDIVQLDSVYPQSKSDTMMLTPGREGGEIQDRIESLYGKKFVCSYCGKEHPCKLWMGHPHENGTSDKDDKKYWMMIKCQNSGNYVSLQQILNGIIKE